MDTPTWTRLFRVRPYLGGRMHGITLPFTARLDHVAALCAFTIAWWVTLWVTGWYQMNPVTVPMLRAMLAIVGITGPTILGYRWLKHATVDGRDRIEQIAQGTIGLAESANHRWRNRNGVTNRHIRYRITVGGA